MSSNSHSAAGPIRRDTHAGSWYVNDAAQLASELDGWLSRVVGSGSSSSRRPPSNCGARAIIAPHAGYRYCGACAAHAYAQVDPTNVRRVFVLGPSHHVRLGGCALSACAQLRTPLYPLPVDRATTEELLATGDFEVMSLETEEDEHSIEMHLPYVARVLDSRSHSEDFAGVVPVLVGSLSQEKESRYGRIFAKYLADPHTLFVISSDFCHWGQRFRYQHYDEKCGEIHQSIKELDYMGMNIIESLDHDAFSQYLKKYGNTICGRHPIGVFLGAVSAMRKHGNGVSMNLKFLNYDQSNQCKTMKDSSVSYAAATFTIG